ncbi:MAG: DUF5686 and carboxypeptidase regulatory-like domain-containing protein [Bacteroidetes bacterium]|nr:DUF5686 and carboxypeptidase regulatory-like domain-containing protein [Bacteroidota bacterium]
MKSFIFALLLIPKIIFSQTEEVKGKVTDQETNNPLPYATILLSGTNKGTVSNTLGEFSFKLKPGEHVLITRYVGYKNDSLKIFVPEKKTLEIKLQKQMILLPEIVVTGEDPAYGIIREAIKRKRINKKGLENFEYSAYSKNIMKSAGEIALVEETIIKGYNKPYSWEKEFIIKRHRTENQKKTTFSMSAISDLTDKFMLDFSSDTLTLLMNKIYLPIADNAFDYYDYKLINIIKTNGAPVYVIKVIPLSKIQPLVEGTIYIEGESYSVSKVDLNTSKGVRFPYIQNMSFNFKQTLGRYDGYWLPDYLEFDASFEFNFGGLLKIEPLSFQTINSISEYKINQTIPDSVIIAVRSQFGGFTSDTSKTLKDKKPPEEISASEMKELRPIPLTNSENKAFAELDSTMTLEKTIKIKGALSNLIPEPSERGKSSGQNFFGKTAGFLTSYVYADNNRVGYISLGAKYKSGFFSNKIFLNTFAGYSFGIKKPVGSFLIGYRPSNLFFNVIEVEMFNLIQEWQVLNPYPGIMNAASVLIGFEDQFNYYLSTGYKIGLMKRLNKNLVAGLYFSSDKQASLKEYKYFSIFSRKRYLRLNPIINDGFDRKIKLTLQYGKSPFELQLIPEDGMLMEVETSSKTINSDFDYTKYFIAGQIKAKTFYRELFVSPYLLLNFEAGYINGNFGIQHLFSPTTAMGVYSPANSFKGLKPYQFAGDKIAAIHVEHNWRTIIFQALGMDFLTNMDLDIVTGASALEIMNDTNYFPELSRKKFYWEAYAGISRILAILKLDFYYTSLKTFGATISTAVIF